MEKAAGVTRKVEGEVARTRGGDAGEGEILQEGAEFFVVGDVGGWGPSFAPNLADSGGASSFVPLVRDFEGLSPYFGAHAKAAKQAKEYRMGVRVPHGREIFPRSCGTRSGVNF